MNGPVRRLSIGLFAGFFALLLAVTWIQVIHADVLKADPRNSRPALSERGKERGLIVTIDGTVVAQSVPDPEDPRSFIRQYPEGEPFAHVVGYNSFLVGSSGLENAYADELRSRRDLTISDLVSVILGRDLRPESLELTINADLQRAGVRGSGWAEGRGGRHRSQDRGGAGLRLVAVLRPGVAVGRRRSRSLGDPPGRSRRSSPRPRHQGDLPAGLDLQDSGDRSRPRHRDSGAGDGVPRPRGVPVCPALRRRSPTPAGASATTVSSITLLQAFIVSCNTTFADLSIQVGAEDVGITAEALGFNVDIPFPWTVPEAIYPVDLLAETLPHWPRAASGNEMCAPHRCIWRWWLRRSPTTASPSPLIS